MDDVLDQSDAADWVYRGEGAANLVLAYTGSSPFFVGKVMRIQKVPRNRKRSQSVNGGSILSRHDKLLWRDYKELVSSSRKEMLEQLYTQHIMGPLLGPKLVDSGRRVLVSREFLESVQKNVDCQRPAWRVDAAEIDTHSDSVLLLSDHALFPHVITGEEPCIAVEIKPKCGFLPISKFIADENVIKRSISRFRMHQILKFRQNQISEISLYDPLDLFSGSKKRIFEAIKALYSTPQNNFRIFLNGSLIFGGLGGGTSLPSSEIGEALEDALKCFIQADYGLRTMNFLELVAKTVYQAGVMNQLLEVQKLDNFDIEGAIHAYYNIVSQPCKVCKEVNEGKVTHQGISLHSITLDESLKIVKDYLLAATAKDCSLMICFRPRKDEDSGSSRNSIYLESTNQFFEYKACFIDLDLKPLKKMEHYYELDNKLVCSKCRREVIRSIAKVEGITSVGIDPSKNTVTVIGEADPVQIIKRVRKFRKSASIVSVGPFKDEKKDEKKEEKKDVSFNIVPFPYPPTTCQRCDIWYVARVSFGHCSIL